jgi:hypothetical protein
MCSHTSRGLLYSPGSDGVPGRSADILVADGVLAVLKHIVGDVADRSIW